MICEKHAQKMLNENLAEYGVIFFACSKFGKTGPGGPKGPKRFFGQRFPFQIERGNANGRSLLSAGAYGIGPGPP